MKNRINSILAGIISAVILVTVSFSSAFAAAQAYNGFEYNVVNNYSVSIVGYQNNDSAVVFPNKIGERWVLSINYEAFRDNDYITSLDFSEIKYLETIGYAAFMNCKALNNSVEIPDTVTFIGSYAFMNCAELPSVMINSSRLKSITDGCFCGCNLLQSVTLTEGVESIGNIAFASCSSLEYVNIPKSVTEIHEYAFSNDPNLTLGVWYGSYGYEYAIAQNIPYVLLDGAFLGDANGDGLVNINDVTTIQRYHAEMETLEGIALHAADVNGDGNVTIEDATVLQRYFAEFDDVPESIGKVMTQ